MELLDVENAKPDFFAWKAEPGDSDDRMRITISTTDKTPPAGILKGALVFDARVGDTESQARIEAYGLVE